MRYGHQLSSLRGFSREHGLNHFAKADAIARHYLSALKKRWIYLPFPPTGLNRDIQHPDDLPFSVAPSLKRFHWWCRNINLLSIVYAFQPRLRYRLTLRRLTLPRKPWTHGERVSNPLYRYSCLHNHFQGLHTSLSVVLHRQLQCSSTTPCGVRGFGVMLKPRYIFGAGSLDQ